MATLLPVPDSLERLRDDLMEWNANNLKVRVPNTRTINNKALDKDIVLNYEDVGADKAGSAQTAKDEAISIANKNASEAISNALTNANSYTDQQINQEVINRNNAISTEVNNLNNTINQAIATEAKDRNSAIATAKQEAINTANQNTTTLVNNVKTELKEYTDNIVQEEVGSVIDDSVTTYTETWSSKKISGMVTDAKTYAETKANDALTAAKSYTNSEISKEVTNRNSAIATAKQEAINAAASDATTKANKALSDAKADAKSKADAALESAKTYTNNQINNVKVEVNNYTDTKASQILQEAKTYTDTNSGSDIKNLIGSMSSLKTTAKDTVVNAINEVFQLGSNVKNRVVAALQYSNLGVTNDSTWDEIINALYNKFPQYTITATNFSYNGKVQTYTAPATGTYQLEVWGAQGAQASGSSRYITDDHGGEWNDYGTVSTTCYGGNGGYSKGNISLTAGQVLYVVVGGAGSGTTGGYNGGGNGYYESEERNSGGGGGATHIATATGLLSELSSNKSAVKIVAGGGGGACIKYFAHSDLDEPGNYGGNGGTGGGTSGGIASAVYSDHNPELVGTQSSGYAFGQGQSAPDGNATAGCGGGYYGGKTTGDRGGTGGSGYIGGVSSGSTSNGSRSGNGYATIKFVG